MKGGGLGSLAVSFALLTCLGACRAEPGALQVVSYPLAEILVDGHATGISTPVHHHVLVSGPHVVSLRRAGVRFVEQTVSVRAGHTTHLYFRARDPDGEVASGVLCTTGREDLCWARIDTALRANDRVEARTLGETYLSAHPDGGYAIVVRDIVNRLGGHALAPGEADPE